LEGFEDRVLFIKGNNPLRRINDFNKPWLAPFLLLLMILIPSIVGTGIVFIFLQKYIPAIAFFVGAFLLTEWIQEQLFLVSPDDDEEDND